jgi:serine/threonine protein kinase
MDSRMPDAPDTSLSASDHQHLTEQALALEKAWRQAGESVRDLDLAPFLPRASDPLRLPALHLLLRVDLTARWQRGQRFLLESYLKRFPELGPPQALPAELVCHEYRIRHLLGDKPARTAYQVRFPRQFSEMELLLQEELQHTPGGEATVSCKPPFPQAGANPPAVPSLPAPSSLPAAPPGGGSSMTIKPPPLPAPPSGTVSGPAPMKSVGIGYQLIKKLGSGTFGEVWKADGPGGTEVAVKIITRPIDARASQQELVALEHVKRLRHPYLVQTQAFWVEGDRLFIVMDLADSSLSQRAAECKKGLPKGTRRGIPTDELLRYMAEVAEALDYLHEAGVHHRDVKPANILLLRGHARLADFGLARPLTGSLVAATLGGTPAYMAPEVWEGLASSHSDQWSLAAVYYELRTGRRLFRATELVTMMREISQGEPNLSALPEAEQEVVRQAMARAPRDRFPTCAAFVEALREAQRPIPPPPPPAPRPAPRKSRPLAWLALALLCGVSMSFAGAVWLAPYFREKASGAPVAQEPAELQPQHNGIPDPQHPKVPPPVPPAPRIEVAALRPISVSTGRETTFPLALVRHDFLGRVRISCADPDLPKAITIGPQEVPAGQDRVTMHIRASQSAVPTATPYRVSLLAEGLDDRGSVVATAKADLRFAVLFLPAGFEPVRFEKGGYTLADSTGTLYYRKIALVLDDGTRVPFLLVPRKSRDEVSLPDGVQQPDTFYIMQTKVSLSLFRKIARQHKELHHLPGKSREEDDPDLPVFNVTLRDAQAFAKVGLKGNLPTAAQWDKAAGRFERPRRGEGPFREKWSPERKDIAVLGKPVRVGTAEGDVSEPYLCRDMAGNGYEWTRSLLSGIVDGRGHSYKEGSPLTYKDIDESIAPALRDTEPSPEVSFRVVIEP